MEGPSDIPQPDNQNPAGEMPLQSRLTPRPQMVPSVNLTTLGGTSLHAPRKSTASTSATGHQEKKQLGSNSKVAIPRQRSGAAPRYSRRVPLAFNVQNDSELSSLSTKAQEYENLLKDIGNVVDGRTAERIRSTLEKFSASGDSSSQPSSVTPQDEDIPDDLSAPSSIGSLDAIDRVDEDVNRNASSRATGYMGKNSEVTWLQRLRKEAEQRSRKLPGTYEAAPEGEFALHSMNYHLDDMDISVPGPVHALQMPPRQVADKLFENYLESIHPCFPIISRTLFSAQYKTFFDSAARPGYKWLAILNVIFAIAAKHAHLMQAPWRGDDNDHLVYLTRARILSMNGDILFSHPDLQQVQVEGLIAFYLLSSDQINRSWRITALAVRSAISLGLNMKNTSESTNGVSKEMRYRVWWCLYIFEHILGVMTGRSSCISDGICTTPLPLPFEEDKLREPEAAKLLDNQELRQECVESALASNFVRQMSLNPPGGRDTRHTDKVRDTSWLMGVANSKSLIFLYFVDLSVIVQEIINRVYSLDCIMTPWAHMENRMGELRARVDLWFSNLPKSLDFTQKEDQDITVLRGKLFLAFHYYSARITLGRPCLCRRDAQLSPSQKSSFSHDMAVTTLKSARWMLDLLPDQPDALRLYEICPWWCILHYLMQATTVLLLELSFGSIHMPNDEQVMLEASKKAIRWLFSMAHCSLASRRAWDLCDSNLRRMAKGMNYDLRDMPTFDTEGNLIQPDNTIPTSLFDSSQPLVAAAEQAQGSGYQPQQTHQAFSAAPGTFGALPPTLAMQSDGDVYFPYDPISGEFIRSFFPSTADEEPWDQS
ncbi:hypothetical protein FE257_007616 [Aspergillus nanangensis]|uniref:Xylanolytic transcriptional activator regulatory domain-containing protein n=1 Tax=Aspergillus nanangensis TaxID=2582783 RepID=A0AAD4CP45_ASPNN|nr:hypothetical protein FE257_007616 [Aspergillus nanangensis]